MTQQELIEADRCFQHVCELIRIDGVSPRSVLFGSTLSNWLKDNAKIVVVGHTPNSNYMCLAGVTSQTYRRDLVK